MCFRAAFDGPRRVGFGPAGMAIEPSQSILLEREEMTDGQGKDLLSCLLFVGVSGSGQMSGYADASYAELEDASGGRTHRKG